MEINVHEAKTNFSKLLRRVAAGEEITIARAGVPVARLVPVEPAKRERKLGIDQGKIFIAEDFDAPLPDDILAGFLGEEPPRKKARRGR
jgi:prevent-host-death family protein